MTPSPTDLALSPPYWIPFLIALGMVLTFLGFVVVKVFTTMFEKVMEPLRSSMDRMNNALDKLNETNGKLVEKIAILIDRETRVK